MQRSYDARKIVLRGFTYIACLMYMDNMIVVGRTLQEKFDNLRMFQAF
jgi:hypothetical protein